MADCPNLAINVNFEQFYCAKAFKEAKLGLNMDKSQNWAAQQLLGECANRHN